MLYILEEDIAKIMPSLQKALLALGNGLQKITICSGVGENVFPITVEGKNLHDRITLEISTWRQ